MGTVKTGEEMSEEKLTEEQKSAVRTYLAWEASRGPALEYGYTYDLPGLVARLNDGWKLVTIDPSTGEGVVSRPEDYEVGRALLQRWTAEEVAEIQDVYHPPPVEVKQPCLRGRLPEVAKDVWVQYTGGLWYYQKSGQILQRAAGVIPGPRVSHLWWVEDANGVCCEGSSPKLGGAHGAIYQVFQDAGIEVKGYGP